MNQCKSLTEILGTKFGNEASGRVINRVKHAYGNGTRGNQLGIYLKGVLKAEGMARGGNSVIIPVVYQPSI